MLPFLFRKSHFRPSITLGRQLKRCFQLIAVLLGIGLLVLLRWPWLGHVVTWDEAASLCSVRSFVSRGTDYVAGWFWRRPPLHNLLLSMLAPLQTGFHIRAQRLGIAIAVVNVLALWWLNYRLYGPAVALRSVWLYAVLPGAIFYDTWIKQDSLAAFWGIVALWLFARGRALWSGLALGFSFLSKELAVFYAAALGLLWLQERRTRSWVELGAAYVVAAAASGWWYVLFSNSVEKVLRFLFDPHNFETTVWTRPWYYFLEKLRLDLEYWGVLLAAVGLVALWKSRRCTEDSPSEGWENPYSAWPVAYLVPTYGMFALMRAKTPWYVISTFPAWATLQALGLYALENGLVELIRNRRVSQWACRLLVAVVLGGVIWLQWGRDYETQLAAREPGLWWGSITSRATAERLNQLVQEGERVLITSMHYWAVSKKSPCVIFVYYLRRGIPVIVRPYDISLEEFIDVVKRYRLHWAMVSPEPGRGERELLHPLIQQYGLKAYWNRGACILRTDSLWAGEVSAETTDGSSVEDQGSPPGE